MKAVKANDIWNETQKNETLAVTHIITDKHRQTLKPSKTKASSSEPSS